MKAWTFLNYWGHAPGLPPKSTPMAEGKALLVLHRVLVLCGTLIPGSLQTWSIVHFECGHFEILQHQFIRSIKFSLYCVSILFVLYFNF